MRSRSQPKPTPAIVWFRLDLRLTDNPALQSAIDRGGPVIPVFIHAPKEEAPWQPGGASRWWLHQSLGALDSDLRKAGSRLIIAVGPSLTVLQEVARKSGAGAVFWNRRYEPALIARDALIKQSLRSLGLEVQSFNSALLKEPWEIQNQSGRPFQVFTPYWKHCLARLEPAQLLPPPRTIRTPEIWPKALSVAALELEPKINWAGGLQSAWNPGEAGAHVRLKNFVDDALAQYESDRSRPDRVGTSRLSAHLHFGEIGPRQLWHALRRHAKAKGLGDGWRTGPFLAEIGWREFSHHLLYHFPHTPLEPLRPEFKNFRWRDNPAYLEAWQKGRTGYPIVDAGMRELWATGWMHNRVRMIAGSFLVKDLLLSWTEGARWFWDTLVDADLAQNTLGWQWTAGCGADAAPYFRIFNPLSQGEEFDPQGGYVRRWCPELAKLPTAWLHKPWQAPQEILARAGVRLGQDYPAPMISHTIAREVALEAFEKIKTTPG